MYHNIYLDYDKLYFSIFFKHKYINEEIKE